MEFWYRRYCSAPAMSPSPSLPESSLWRSLFPRAPGPRNGDLDLGVVSTPQISLGPAGCRINKDYARYLLARGAVCAPQSGGGATPAWDPLGSTYHDMRNNPTRIAGPAMATVALAHRAMGYNVAPSRSRTP